jgi:hypothetical protein
MPRFANGCSRCPTRSATAAPTMQN